MIHQALKSRWWFRNRAWKTPVSFKHLGKVRVWFSVVLPEIEIFLIEPQMASYLIQEKSFHAPAGKPRPPIRLNQGETGRSIRSAAGHSAVQIAIYRTCSTCHWQRRRGQMQHPHRDKVDAICCFSARFFSPCSTGRTPTRDCRRISVVGRVWQIPPAHLRMAKDNDFVSIRAKVWKRNLIF